MDTKRLINKPRFTDDSARQSVSQYTKKDHDRRQQFIGELRYFLKHPDAKGQGPVRGFVKAVRAILCKHSTKGNKIILRSELGQSLDLLDCHKQDIVWLDRAARQALLTHLALRVNGPTSNILHPHVVPDLVAAQKFLDGKKCRQPPKQKA